MTNLSQPAPTAGISRSLPLPLPAYHGLGSGDSALSPQAGAAPTSPPGHLPDDHGNGGVSTAGCNTSTSISLGLPEAGMKLEEWLKPVLEDAEVALDRARMTVRVHRWVLWSLSVSGVTIICLAIGMIGAKTFLVPAIIGSILICLGALLTVIASYLIGEYESGDLEAASRHVRELKPFVRGLRGFILGQSHFVTDWPEAETKVKNYRQQLRVIMKGNIWTAEA